MKRRTPRTESAEDRPRFDSLEQEVFLNLWRTYDRLKAIEDQTFTPYDISAQQYNALRLLRAVHPGSIPTLTLGARLISRAPDMTRLIDKLEQRGALVRERRSDNRRVVEVTITPAGLELLEELDAQVQACHHRQLGHLSPEQMAQLVDLLKTARHPHEDVDNRSLVDD